MFLRRLSGGMAALAVSLASFPNPHFSVGAGADARVLASASSCSSASPILTGSSFPEVRGSAPGGSLWALLFFTPPAQVDTDLKIAWRMTGSGALHLNAVGPGGQNLLPRWGPERHGGSTWTRPGDEWGAGFRFPVPGCWRIHAQRDTLSGDIWLSVVPRTDVPPPIPTPSPTSATPSATRPCAATRIHRGDFRLRNDLRGVPWVAATPKSSAIFGFLFYGAGPMHPHGVMPSGTRTKILWLVYHKHARNRITVTGTNLLGSETMRQSFAGNALEFPSIINIPSPGCWKLGVRSGSASGTIILRVVP